MGTEPADVIYVVSNAKKADFFYGMCARVFTFASLTCFFFIIIIIILFSLGFLYLLIERRCEFRTFGSRMCAYVFQRACPFMLFSWI